MHIPQLNWDSKEDVDVVAFFESMVSKEADPGFVARAIINAKAKKKVDEDAAEHARKKTKTSSNDREGTQQELQTSAVLKEHQKNRSPRVQTFVVLPVKIKR